MHGPPAEVAVFVLRCFNRERFLRVPGRGPESRSGTSRKLCFPAKMRTSEDEEAQRCGPRRYQFVIRRKRSGVTPISSTRSPLRRQFVTCASAAKRLASRD
jgi:hypothetical protein